MQYITRLLAAERDRLSLWSPVPVMGGIAAYFALADEPPAWLAPALLAAGAALLAVLWRTRFRWQAATLCLLALGFAAANVRTHLVATPLLTMPLEHAEVEGTIDYIDLEEKGTRLILTDPVIEGVLAEQTPVRVRIAFRSY